MCHEVIHTRGYSGAWMMNFGILLRDEHKTKKLPAN